MTIPLAGQAMAVQEIIDTLVYAPALQDSGDLEAATRTVTATAKPGTPDYTASLTIPSPPNARISVLRLGLRLQVTIDSMTAGQLNYSVHVNGTERLTGSWSSTGAQYAVVDLVSSQFNLGSANSLQVYLWVNTGNAVVSVAQIWLGVGTTQGAGWGEEWLRIDHIGVVQLAYWVTREGSGVHELRFMTPVGALNNYAVVIGLSATVSHSLDNKDRPAIAVQTASAMSLRTSNQTVSTDLVHLREIGITLRSLR